MSDQKQIDDGGPAFPVAGHCVDASGAYCGDVVNSKGLSLRDWFAGQALAGILAGAVRLVADDELAKMSYKQADAMIIARKA